MFLLVTLEKKGQREEYRYEDRFLPPDTFQWQSQNRRTQKGKVGQAIRNHAEKDIQVHSHGAESAEGRANAPRRLSTAAEFQWEGEKPITVIWKLRELVPDKLFPQLTG